MSRLLNDLEVDVLEAFFSLDESAAFVLTGGAALAEYHLHHRLSHDLDLFTLDEEAFASAGHKLSELARKINARVRPLRSLVTLNQAMVEREGIEVKVDLVRDAGPVVGQPMQVGSVRVDSLENIGANKILALFGRAAARDYVDLYLILNDGGFTFEQLLDLAKTKDPGLQEFYLAGWLKQQTPKLQTPPDMLREVDMEDVKVFFLELADRLMAGLKPE